MCFWGGFGCGVECEHLPYDEKIKLQNDDETRWFPWFVEALYYHPKSSELTASDEYDNKPYFEISYCDPHGEWK